MVRWFHESLPNNNDNDFVDEDDVKCSGTPLTFMSRSLFSCDILSVSEAKRLSDRHAYGEAVKQMKTP